MVGSRQLGGEKRRPAVASLLPHLKRGGCNLLVAGDVSEATVSRATQRLLGSPDVERKRILVRTADAPSPTDLLPVGVRDDDDTVRVVDYGAARSDGDSLRQLERGVSAAVDEFRTARTPLVGGELRLSVTSLDSLVDGFDPDAVEQFLRRTTRLVGEARGMGHYCYRGPRTDLSDLPLDRLFDGFIDLRDRTRPEQRLSVPSLATTDWVAL